MKQYLAMDIGGTFVKYALTDADGNFSEQGKIPTIRESREEFFDSLRPLAEQYRNVIEGVAVCMPGRLNTDLGISYTAGAFSRILSNCPIGSILEEMFGCPVTIGNDGKCAAAAEAWSGALADVANGAVVILGTGVGGGIVINHQVYMGANFASGELSDIVFDGGLMAGGYSRVEVMKSGKRGMMGMPNPFFSHTGSTSALRMAYVRKKHLPSYEGVTGELIFEKLREGEPEAVEAFDEFCMNVAAGIMTVQAVMDFPKVAIGGGISAAPELLPGIQKAVKLVFDRQGPSFPCLQPEVVGCRYGNDANLLGALKLYLERHN